VSPSTRATSSPDLDSRPPAGLGRGLSVLLVAAVLAVYAPAQLHEFVNYDDPDYVTENRHVRTGISLENVRWAMTTGHAANWHPLTWISHMLDCELFGLDATGHHWTNVVIQLERSGGGGAGDRRTPRALPDRSALAPVPADAAMSRAPRGGNPC